MGTFSSTKKGENQPLDGEIEQISAVSLLGFTELHVRVQPGVSKGAQLPTSEEDGVCVWAVLAALRAGNTPNLLGQGEEHVD